MNVLVCRAATPRRPRGLIRLDGVGGRRSSSDDVLLDAARDSVLEIGLRRTNLTEVARRAGVSRMTMYRRWPDMTALMTDLLRREWLRLAVDAEAEAVGGNGRERLVDALVRVVRALRSHAMFRRVVEQDPQVLLPYLVERRGAVQEAILLRSVVSIRDGQADGSLRAGEPALLGRSLLLAVYGFVLSVATMADGVGEDCLDDQLREMLDRYLRP